MLRSLKFCRVGFALLLSLWIAGGGCMLGCQNMGALAATDEAGETPVTHHAAMIVSGDACAAGEGHDCCAKKKAAAERANSATKTATKPSLATTTIISQTESLIPAPVEGMKQCPLALGRAVAATKPGGGTQIVAALAPSASVLTLAVSPEQHSSLSPAARLPNRGHTYLRCCAFLI